VEVVEAIRERQARLGPNAVRFRHMLAPGAMKLLTSWPKRGRSYQQRMRGRG